MLDPLASGQAGTQTLASCPESIILTPMLCEKTMEKRIYEIL